MTQQEKQEIDKKCDEFCEYRRTHSNGYPPREWFMAGVKALDEIRKPSEPDKELLEALKETDKDLCVLESTMLQIEQRDHLAEGMAELVKKWRARNKQAISKYESK